MGHEGMRASLVSREVIADSVELMVHAERMDGMVLLAGCDKSLPGMLMAAARMDLAACFLYGGSILPGRLGDKDLTILDAFEGVGACAAGRISRTELDEIERHACPTEGSCAGMYTANTMAGRRRGAGHGADRVGRRRRRSTGAGTGFAVRSGEAVVAQLDAGITARKILTKQAFENAITVVMALGGSTNAVLHLLAIAHEARVELTLEDFNRIGDRTPHLADVKPFGRYVMTDVDRIGGIPVVMRALLDAGLLHGDALTVTGRTMAEDLAAIAPPDPDGKIIRALADPIHRTGGLTILHGSLAPGGRGGEERGVRVRGLRGNGAGLRRREGRDGRGHRRAGSQPGDAVVIRYEGPTGGPGMREMLAVTGAIKGAGLGKDVCCSPTAGSPAAPPGRASATSRPRRPTAARSRWSQDGDRIRLDMAAPDPRPAGRRGRAGAAAGRLEARRRPATTTGALAKYAKLVGSAAQGAVCG